MKSQNAIMKYLNTKFTNTNKFVKDVIHEIIEYRHLEG